MSERYILQARCLISGIKAMKTIYAKLYLGRQTIVKVFYVYL